MPACTKCHQDKHVDDFHTRSSRKTGIQSWCKVCVSDNNSRLSHTPAFRSRRRELARTPRYRYNTLRVSSKRGGHMTTITYNAYEALLNEPCHYCSHPLRPTSIGLDRKDSTGYYTIDNVVPCCYECNTTKSDYFSYNEMLIIGKAIKAIKDSR